MSDYAICYRWGEDDPHMIFSILDINEASRISIVRFKIGFFFVNLALAIMGYLAAITLERV